MARKTVRQRTAHDCGICVVAEIARVTYERALDAVFPGKRPKQLYTSSRQLAAALNKRLGIKCDERARPLFGRSYKNLKHDAILLVDRDPKTWSWHWCVWDWKRKRVIDPAKRPKRRWRVTSFLKVYRD